MKRLQNLKTLAFLSLMAFSVNVASAKDVEDKIKDAIDDVSEFFKDAVDKMGDDFDAAQEYLDHYDWKGVIQGEAKSGAITLSDLRLNNHHRVIVVHPGEKIKAHVACTLDPKESSAFELYRVIIGFKGRGAQTTICNSLGMASGTSIEKFKLHAPKEPGVYEIRFRTVHKLLEGWALDKWTNKEGKEPDASTTIGIVVVK